MNYTEAKKKEKELQEKNNLDYLKVNEEIKQALCNMSKRARGKKEEKLEDLER